MDISPTRAPSATEEGLELLDDLRPVHFEFRLLVFFFLGFAFFGFLLN